MIDKRRLVTWLRTIMLACAGPGLYGCSEELGPERFVVTRVNGVVNEGGRPVSAGWIEFFPVDGTVGSLCSARLRSNGTFEAERVPVGVNLVRLVNAPFSSIAARQMFGAYTSPIRRTIPAQNTAPVVIDVVDEAIRWRQSQTPSTRPEFRGSGETR